MPANTAPPSGGGAPNAATPRRHGAGAWTIVLGLLALNLVFAFAFDPAPKHRSVPYSAFRAQVGTGNIEEVSSKGSTIQGRFRHEIRYPKGAGGHDITAFETERPAFAHDDLLAALLARGTIVNAKPVQSGRSTLLTLLLGFAPTLLIVGFFLWMMRRATGSMGAGGGMLGGMGRSRARRYADRGSRTTFADVAGIDEATDELSEVVDFLRHPERYRRLGGVTPKGVLLTGPPGTGKTLLARAVAGEADVPFFSVSASEFVEMIVGVGASRVRDLFDQAKKDAPSIVFIDELDAIGRARGGSAMSGASDEREQTLNQILTEMDGFTGSEGVIVLAATNRPEILDPALLRAGRFDRRIAINPPDRAGRLQILRVHTRSVPLAGDDILDTVASTTPGMVGADLRTLVNEAALGAARREHVTVQLDDFSTALERILLGAARRIVLSEDDRRRTAYHEAGHALLGMLQVGADPVRKVSIIPRGNTLGVTFQSPEADRHSYGEQFLHGRLIGMMGGHAAERLVYDETTTGAESDLEQATALARQMVGRWGMSETVGLVTALPQGVGDWPPQVAPHTLELIDEEVRRMTEESHRCALHALAEHRGQLDALAAALLEHETLDEAEAHRAAGIPPSAGADDPAPAAANVLARA